MNPWVHALLTLMEATGYAGIVWGLWLLATR